MFEIIDIIDEDFDHYDSFETKPQIEDDPNDDLSWLPLNRWDDRHVTM